MCLLLQPCYSEHPYMDGVLGHTCAHMYHVCACNDMQLELHLGSWGMCIFNTSITRLPWWPTLHQQCGAVLMYHILAKTWYHFDLCQLDVCEIIHHCCFNLHFHYIRRASLFKSTGILSFSCEFLVYIFCPFFYWSFSHLVSF